MMRTLLAFAFLGGVAAAQDVSDLQPPPVTGPSVGYVPGMPSPNQPSTPSSAASPSSKGTGHYIFDDANPEEPSLQGGPTSGDTYVVRRGDTLWSISSSFLRSPWAWPKLWSYNPAITNPHWIYPGDVIRLGSERAPETQAPVAKPEKPTRILEKPRGTVDRRVTLQQHGFVEPGELDSAGTIVGSKEEKIMLATLDEAYVDFKNGKPLELGKRYTVYKPIRTVYHPVTKKRLGEVVEIFGDAEVRPVTDGNIARVVIVDSFNPIERGFKVGPLKKTYRIGDPKPARVDLKAVVVTTLRLVELIGTNMLAFVDVGRADGVEIGNRMLVVRRGDGYQPVLARGTPVDDPRFPRETIAEMIIVDLRGDHLATGVVTSAVKEANVGDRVEMRKGY
jgi:hypothetical protein